MRRSVIAALAVGLVSIGIGIIAVLAHSPLTVVGTNSVPAKDYIELEEKGKLSNCQSAGVLPQGTSAIRFSVEGLHFSPTMTARVLVGSHVLREGHVIAGGPSIPNVTVPITRLAHAVSGASICATVGPAVEPIRFSGTPRHTSAPSTNPLQEASLHIEYLRPDTKSWSSFVSAIVDHMGLGHAPSGSWVAYLVLILMLLAIFIVVRVTLEELG